MSELNSEAQKDKIRTVDVWKNPGSLKEITKELEQKGYLEYPGKVNITETRFSEDAKFIPTQVRTPEEALQEIRNQAEELSGRSDWRFIGVVVEKRKREKELVAFYRKGR